MKPLFALLCAIVSIGSFASAAEKPNIIVILVDDMGWSDVGCYGSEIPTPHIDALARGGLRFTQFYNTGRCCPTRASLLTGVYPHQAGVGHMTNDSGLPGYRGRLNDNAATIAEHLKSAGYFTAMTGKWHVGQNAGVTPWGRGFERNLTAAAGGFFMSGSARAQLFLNGAAVKNDDARLPKDWYSTDLWTSFGLKFIDEARSAKKPFFLYLAHNAPHFPLQAPAEDIAKFRGKYKAGWDALRRERHSRQIETGMVDKAWTPAPRPDQVKAWDALSDAEKDRFDHLMAVYAAVMVRMDKAIGDLTAGLRERGAIENTLILFMSDNGGNAEAGPEGRSSGDPSQADSNWFCGESWAYLQNTPFQRYKHYNHEGGIATPLIAHWPAGITAKNELRTQPAHLVDILPTCLEAAGGAPLKEINGSAALPLEGRSLVPVFAGKAIERDALFWEHEGNAAVRTGDLKLVRLGRDGPWELYDLKSDRTEQNNLAKSQPDKVKELADKWGAWAVRAHVKPYPTERSGKKDRQKKAKKEASSP